MLHFIQTSLSVITSLKLFRPVCRAFLKLVVGGSAFIYLYDIQHIQKYLTSECAEKLIHAFITSRLDYYNSLLYGVPGHHMQKLQRVMNACVQLIFCAPIQSFYAAPLTISLVAYPPTYRV